MHWILVLLTPSIGLHWCLSRRRVSDYTDVSCLLATFIAWALLELRESFDLVLSFNLIGCYEKFCEQKIDQKCTLIPVLTPKNIEIIGITNTVCPSPVPKVTIYTKLYGNPFSRYEE